MANKFVDTNGVKKIKAMVRQDIDAHHDASKQDTLVSGTDIKTINNESLLGSGNIDISATPMVETTWAALKALRDNSQLIPGMQYRITDYVTTTAQANSSSAGHQFDVIVVADAADKLNENARAALHAGDTYFASCKLDAWRLLYCLDNDTDRFAWADSANGKGVIYRMIDEFENDVYYDFKNILFTYSRSTSPAVFSYSDCYTFTCVSSDTKIDASLDGKTTACYKNKLTYKYYPSRLGITVFYNNASILQVMWNVFENCNYNYFSAGQCSSNQIHELSECVVDSGFKSNIFMGSISGSKIGKDCQANVIGKNLESSGAGTSNDIGNNFKNNSIFASIFKWNTIANNFSHNFIEGTFNENTTLGSCSQNHFGSGFYDNIVGTEFRNNFVCAEAYSNKFCGYCSFCYFGGYTTHCTFGTTDGTNKFYMQKCTFPIRMEYVDFTCSISGASYSSQVQNITVHAGITGDSATRLAIDVPVRGQSYSIDYYTTGSQEINI